MKEADVELVLQRAREKFPQARPQIISDNGPQCVVKDFNEFLCQWQTTHVLTSPHYPQSNGKFARYHRTLKEEAIRPKAPLTLEDARRVVGEFVEHYNTVWLHSALAYVTPKDRLEGGHTEVHSTRDRKLEAARATDVMARTAENKTATREQAAKIMWRILCKHRRESMSQAAVEHRADRDWSLVAAGGQDERRGRSPASWSGRSAASRDGSRSGAVFARRESKEKLFADSGQAEGRKQTSPGQRPGFWLRETTKP